MEFPGCYHISTGSITAYSVMQVHMSIKSVNQPWLAVRAATATSHLVWPSIFKKTWGLPWNDLKLIGIWQWCQFSSHTDISCSVPSVIVLFFLLIIMDSIDTELLACAIICSLFFTLTQHLNSVFQKDMWHHLITSFTMHYNVHFSFNYNVTSFLTAAFNTFTTFMLVRHVVGW
jgi:hypothetical protein